MTVYRKTISKVKNKGNLWFRDILYSARFKKHEVPLDRKLILCYHGIDKIGNTRFNSKFISQAYFEKQLIYFKKNFNLVSLKDFFKLKKDKVDKFTIALTFDDGYRNNYKYVLPLLEKYQVPAAFFITGIKETNVSMLWGDFYDLAAYFSRAPITYKNTIFRKNIRGDYVRRDDGKSLKELLHESNFEKKKEITSLFPDEARNFEGNLKYIDYWEQMDEDEIKDLSTSKLVTIGSHGHYHNDLSKMPLNEAMAELELSRRYLENIIQQDIVDLAFPYGNYSDELLGECIKMGFERIVSLEYKSNKREDTFHDRFGMNPYISWNNQLHFLLKGRYI